MAAVVVTKILALLIFQYQWVRVRVASFSYKDANNVQMNPDSKMFHMNREIFIKFWYQFIFFRDDKAQQEEHSSSSFGKCKEKSNLPVM